jgi:hypothetical protein
MVLDLIGTGRPAASCMAYSAEKYCQDTSRSGRPLKVIRRLNLAANLDSLPGLPGSHLCLISICFGIDCVLPDCLLPDCWISRNLPTRVREAKQRRWSRNGRHVQSCEARLSREGIQSQFLFALKTESLFLASGCIWASSFIAH